MKRNLYPLLLLSIVLTGHCRAGWWPWSNESPDASEVYQQLGQEAFEALGLHRELRLPIKKMLKTDFQYSNSLMRTGVNDIAVNEEKCDLSPYVFKKYCMLHEAVHCKYQDAVLFTITSSAEMERRADWEAIQALGCSICIDRVAHCVQNGPGEKSGRRAQGGYMPSSEMYALAQEFKRDNRVCRYHEAQAKEPTIISMLNTLSGYGL